MFIGITQEGVTKLIILIVLLAASLLTSAASSNQTNLLAGHRGTSRSSRVTDVLVITTTVGVLHRIHGHTTNLWPAVALHAVFVVCTASFEHWFVHTTTSSKCQQSHGSCSAPTSWIRMEDALSYGSDQNRGR